MPSSRTSASNGITLTSSKDCILNKSIDRFLILRPILLTGVPDQIAALLLIVQALSSYIDAVSTFFKRSIYNSILLSTNTTINDY